MLSGAALRMCVGFGIFTFMHLSCQEKNVETATILNIQQQLMDGIASDDRDLWDQYLMDSCLITIEDGTRLSKKDFLAQMHPLPATHAGRIKILEPKIIPVASGVYAISYIVDEYLDLYDQHIHTQYIESNTWVKGNGWKLAAMQAFEIPKNPHPIPLTEDAKDIAGVYRVSEQMTYSITFDEGKLMGTRSGGVAKELFRESGDVYFDDNPRVRKIFIRKCWGCDKNAGSARRRRLDMD